MLKLKELVKDYKVADTKVRALDSVDLNFRSNEFVSILGPSGCGKTTLLNIIGGLDKYTSGDVCIAGVSTTQFRDSDWDVYRNHRIGFIFQSYNLIPHQSVLGNVELALTIAGIGKQERTERAKKALDRVGLSGQYDKRPNQLSGGQCQRVAIARALVNEPEILLADEPTGALDTNTSVQIMELIKEIAEEKLVIMVTHNPELAEKYSTRIIRLLDGKVVDDTRPYSDEEEREEVEQARIAEEKARAEAEAEAVRGAEEGVSAESATTGKKRKSARRGKEKAKMSLFTAFRLSAQNLFTKKARTIMTSVAGAIGIIGVSLVLAMSYGVHSYIDGMQNDMLSGNPITIQETAFDMDALMGSMTEQDVSDLAQQAASEAIRDGKVNVDSMIEYLVRRQQEAGSLMVENDITREYVEYVKSLPAEDAASVFLNYGLDVSNNIYTDFYIERAAGDDAIITAPDAAGGDVNIPNKRRLSLAAIRTQYIAILKQTMFKDYAAYITTIVDNFKQAPASESYVLTQYDLVSGTYAKDKNEVMIVLDEQSKLTDILLAQLGYYTQDEFMNLVYRGASETDESMKPLYDPALDKDAFDYDELLGKTFTWYPNDTVFTEVTNEQMKRATPFTYSPEASDEWTNKLELKISGVLVPKDGISYGCMESGFYYTSDFAEYVINANLNSALCNYLKTVGGELQYSGFANTAAPGGQEGETVQVPTGIVYSFDFIYRNADDLTKKQGFPRQYGFVGTPGSMGALLGALGSLIPGGDSMFGGLGGSEMYQLSLQQAGGSDLPARLAIYPYDFEHKDSVLAYLDRWNDSGDISFTDSKGNAVTVLRTDRKDVVYTDTLSIIIGMINTFVDIVTVALVGFTALSLVVSSVMIAIITYVSVVERVKEIGVIRALGGRKKDVSRLFTAETAIIGLAAGLIGILITYIVSAIINVIVGSITVVSSIAILPAWQALVMIGVSVVLTLISGVFPARAAAKKDPVVALRTE